jgi:hypothetical protein
MELIDGGRIVGSDQAPTCRPQANPGSKSQEYGTPSSLHICLRHSDSCLPEKEREGRVTILRQIESGVADAVRVGRHLNRHAFYDRTNASSPNVLASDCR